MFSARRLSRLRFGPSWSIACGVVLALGLIFAAVTRAEPDTQPTTHPAAPATQPADLAAMSRSFGDLASSDARVRESARLQLMRLHREDLPALRQLVERSRPLAPSQDASLRQIVQEIYLSGEEYEKDSVHGFLGILMDETALGNRDAQMPNDGSAAPGVVVTDRIPGFCAARNLLDGDVILGTTQPVQIFNSPADLKYAIGGLDPGSIVHLQILRHGQVLQVTLTLDSKPIEADTFDAAESFRNRRADKFNDYWQKTFAPLLNEAVG